MANTSVLSKITSMQDLEKTFLCVSSLTLSHKDNLSQKENRLQKLEHFTDDIAETHLLKKKESTHNSKYDSAYDKLVFKLESLISFFRAELAKREKMFKNEIRQ